MTLTDTELNKLGTDPCHYEGIVIFALILSCVGVKGFRIVTVATPVKVSPLELALEYESPDAKFEELVKKYPEWLPYRPNLKDSSSMSILTSCAMLHRTNYVRILIANGANVEEAVKWHREFGSSDAVKLLRQIETEVLLGPGSSDRR